MPLSFLQTHERGVVVAVRVTPRASRTRLLGVMGHELKMAISAPPVEGAANLELVKGLSKILGFPKSRIEILAGHTARSKRVLLLQADLEEITAQFLSLVSGK